MQNTSGNGQTGNQGSTGSGGAKPAGLSWAQPSAQKPGNTTSSAQQKPFTPPLLKPTTPVVPQHKMTGQNSGMGRTVGIFASGIIIGFLLGWGWTASRPADTAKTATSTTTTKTSTSGTTGSSAVGSNIGVTSSGAITAASNADLTVPSPQDAGFQVAIANASVSAPTWVVVYDNVNGVPGGKALGAMVFFPTTRSGAIELLRGTLPGGKYFVGELLDDGDFVFSTQNDKPVRDAEGNPLWVSFETK